jgi:transposase
MGWVSGQAYSQDLRSRVLAAVDRGGRVYEVAPLFEVSVSYIYKALARRRLHVDARLLSDRGSKRPSAHHRRKRRLFRLAMDASRAGATLRIGRLPLLMTTFGTPHSGASP